MVTKFLNIDTDSSLTANSNERVPSQKAIKTYTDAIDTAKQNKTLTTPITVGTIEETTVEGALGGISTSLSTKQDQTLSSSITVAGTPQTTVEGALSAINTVAGSAVQPSDLATIATTGSYNDLLDKPTIPAAQVQSDWDESDESDVAYIKNKPYIPSEVIVDQTYDSTSTHAQSGTAVAQAISTKQDALTAGNNITISSNVISAKDTTYVAGTGISITEDSDDNLVISNTQMSAEWGNISGTLSNQTDLATALSAKQDTLTAGDNITINNNVISADVPENVYTADNLLPGDNVTFTSANNIVIASNFGNLSYVQTTAIQKEQTSTLVIETKFARTGNSVGNSTHMGYILNVSNLFGIGIQGGSSTYLRWYYINGSSVFSSTSFSTVLNKEYYLRCTLSSSLIRVEISEDKVNYTTIINYTSSHRYTSDTSYMQLGAPSWNSTTDYFVGKIWLSDTKVYVDNVSILDLSNSSDYTITGSPTIQTIASGNVVINAKDTTYTAGTGISITEDSDENLVISNTQTSAQWGNITGTLSNQTDLQTALNDKQDTLVSGTNIKTVNGNSLLGSGNVDIDALPSQTGHSGEFLTTDGTDASWADIPAEVDNKSVTLNSNDEIQTVGVIDQNNPTKAIKKWTGTKAEYDAIVTKDPDTEYITTDENETVYQNSYRIGQVLPSILPISDYGLHLLDGAVIDGTGIYSSFYSYIAGLVSTYPNLFISEADWQTAVTTYGVCGKFVYDSTNQTIRLPKITGIIEGTTDVTALGDLVQAGLPNITGGMSPTGLAGVSNSYGAFYDELSNTIDYQSATRGGYGVRWGFNASRSSSIYGNSNTVQPQTIKVYYYIVIANSYQTPTGVQISKVATDLNGKVNLNSSWGMPSTNSISLTISNPADTTFTAPADGYFYVFIAPSTTSNYWFHLYNSTRDIGCSQFMTNIGYSMLGYVPACKGDSVVLNMRMDGATQYYGCKFIYAQKDNN